MEDMLEVPLEGHVQAAQSSAGQRWLAADAVEIVFL